MPEIGWGSTTPFLTMRRRPARSVISMLPSGRNTSEKGRSNPLMGTIRNFWTVLVKTCGPSARVSLAGAPSCGGSPAWGACWALVTGTSKPSTSATMGTDERFSGSGCIHSLLAPAVYISYAQKTARPTNRAEITIRQEQPGKPRSTIRIEFLDLRDYVSNPNTLASLRRVTHNPSQIDITHWAGSN